MFGRILPVTLALTARPRRRLPDRSSRLEGELVHSLLQEALLRQGDLPPGFVPLVGGEFEGRPSLFDGGSYEGRLSGEARVRFAARRTRQIIEQQIGRLAEDAVKSTAGVSLASYMADREEADTASPAVAAAHAIRYQGCVRFEALMLRRHRLVMAIASWQIGEKREGALRPRDLAPVADARWRDVADVLATRTEDRSR